MSIVTLVSGGLDSLVMALLARNEGLEQVPLFIDYGQLNRDQELRACRTNLHRHGLPEPVIAALPGYGALIHSGLTDSRRHIVEEAFLPGRNLLFALVGASYAVQHGAGSIGIGLLDDAMSIFPDQTRGFVLEAESLLSRCLDTPIRVIAPLMAMSKAHVVAIARELGITGTYSCHAGTDIPCGVCVACREYIGLGA